MNLIEIFRLEENSKYGTLGVVRLDKRLLGATLEPPDKLNIRNLSNIPAKLYRCTKYMSVKFGYPCITVMDVPGRTAISVHPGNTLYNTEGCILVGQFPEKLKGEDRSLKNSGDTFKKLMENITSSTIYLSIEEHY